MSDFKVHEAAECLVGDVSLMRDIERFADALSIFRVDFNQWKKEHNRGNMTNYVFLKNILQSWASQEGRNASSAKLTQILKRCRFNSAADLLQQEVTNVDQVKPFCVKKPIHSFVGRTKELAKLENWFLKKSCCALLISGLGGQGKTELTRKFIQQLLKNQAAALSKIVPTWFFGDGAQRFSNSLSDFAKTLGLQPSGKPSVDQLIAEMGQCMRNYKWLVIIDNVDETFEEFLPAVKEFLNQEAFVLVTSRKIDILPSEARKLALDELHNKDAWQFIVDELELSKPDDLVKQLCRQIQNYPLALQQSAAYIKGQKDYDRSYGIEQFLEELNKDNPEALQYEMKLTGYDQTISKIMNITLNHINTALGGCGQPEHLLDIISLINPDDIKTEFLEKLFSLSHPVEVFDKSLKVLTTFSLILVNGGYVFIHRVAQKEARKRLKSDVKKWTSTMQCFLQNIVPSNLYRQELKTMLDMIRHVPNNKQFIEANSSFLVEFKNSGFDKYHMKYGVSLEDFQSNDSDFQLFRDVLGPDHIDTLRLQFFVIYSQYSSPTAAKPEYKKLLQRQKQVLDDNHQYVIDTEWEIFLCQ